MQHQPFRETTQTLREETSCCGSRGGACGEELDRFHLALPEEAVLRKAGEQVRDKLARGRCGSWRASPGFDRPKPLGPAQTNKTRKPSWTSL